MTGTGAVKKELDYQHEELHNALQTLKTELAEVRNMSTGSEYEYTFK